MRRGRKPIDFTGVDLTRPTKELANELGCCDFLIYRQRKRECVKQAPILLNLDGLDFSRPAFHIAKELGIPAYYLYYQMRKQGISRRKRGTPLGSVKSNNRFNGVILDWSMRDVELCGPNNCTREYIRQLRKKAGEPASGSREWADKYHPVKTSPLPDT